MVPAAAIVVVLFGAKLLVQLWLEHLNSKEVRKHAGGVPEAFAGTMDGKTYEKAVEYTLAKGRFGRKTLVFDTVLIVFLIIFGVFYAFYAWFTDRFGSGVWWGAAFLFTVGVLLSIPSMPWDWVEQF